MPRGSFIEISQNGIVSLDVHFDEKTGYKFLVRHPALEKLSDSRTRLNLQWKPVPGFVYNWNCMEWDASLRTGIDELIVAR